jgi:hypothetical protein
MSEQAQPQLSFAFSGFTLDQVNIVLAGLRELPYKLTADLIAGITNAAQKQIEEQQAVKPAAGDAAEAPTA